VVNKPWHQHWGGLHKEKHHHWHNLTHQEGDWYTTIFSCPCAGLSSVEVLVLFAPKCKYCLAYCSNDTTKEFHRSSGSKLVATSQSCQDRYLRCCGLTNVGNPYMLDRLYRHQPDPVKLHNLRCLGSDTINEVNLVRRIQHVSEEHPCPILGA
jgi:hypothetical protein